jgi:SAM-dependent methyltransferase
MQMLSPSKRTANVWARGLRLWIRYFYRLQAVWNRYPVYSAPDENDLEKIEAELIANAICLEDYRVDPADVKQFFADFHFGPRFYGGKGILYTEKVLEHFIAFQLGVKRMPIGGQYLDIASCNSPWAMILRSKGYRADALDLEPSLEFSHLPYYHVMDATQMTLPDSSVDCASLQCALEMFIQDADIRLIGELRRILKPGGRVIIVPLYLHRRYCGYCTPEYWRCKQYHDPDAKLYVSRRGFGVPFSRKYDVAQLKRRLIDPIQNNGMSYSLHALRNGPVIDPAIYCHFILEIRKNGTA